MADTIRVTPKELQDKARMMESAGTEIKNLSQNMTAKVTELTGRIWSGEAATQYTSRFNTLYNDVAAVQQLITRMVQQLNTIATEYETTETANTEQAGSLPGSVF